MVICLRCQRSATKRDGFDPDGRPWYSCRPCRRAFALYSRSAFSGSRWPADVILTAVRWSCRYPSAASHVMQLLAERHIDVSARPILTWVQTFGPRLAVAARPYRRRLGRRRWVDEVFCFRGQQKRYVYRAIDQCGQVIDVLLRDKRDRASAEAFFLRALSRTAVVKAVAMGQRFLESCEGLQALRRGHVKLRELVPGYQPTKASRHETTRAVMAAMNLLATQLKKAA